MKHTHFNNQLVCAKHASLYLGGASQASRCLTSCRAVAVALRCDLPSAMLACTVYAASPAATHATLHGGCCGEDVMGTLAATEECLQAFLRLDAGAFERRYLPVPDAREAASSAGRRDGGLQGNAGAYSKEGGAASGSGRRDGAAPSDADLTSEENEEEEDDIIPDDDYLRPPPVRPMRAPPLVTYMAVPALPRGAAVEFQPIAAAGSGRLGTLPSHGCPDIPGMLERRLMCCLMCCPDTFFHVNWALRCVPGSSEATHVCVVPLCNTSIVAAL